ncbi:protein of unknown function [Pseudorhizobium banfieldiae]|uniref:Uncharacterized protein n=1 Tax=Pseudorhizobium banfieldiae TaxID=1125847 RepID=L0NDI4_9HYPH|nr:hypothetical protein [Pseudorhizobium banfieldiae]CAD6606181.1 hypothetical protein RNT25_01805 [arsenite-oxidising bacterium NT-25]CCF19148.1 protein of unknown function [Pseudorhizobium banfieldiae]
MTKFVVLTGSKLNNAIKGFVKAAATFTEKEHQLAYSALNHVELHNDPKYLNALYAVTPANYRRGLVSWSTAFGKVKFDDKARVFEFAKGKKSDMAQAMEIAPANYEKATKGKPAAAFDEVKYLESVVKKLEENGGSPRVLQAVKGALTLAKTPIVAAPAKAPKAAPAAKTEEIQKAA